MHTIGFNRVREIYFALCKGVDTPYSLGMWLRFKYGEYSALVSSSIDPVNYLTADSFKGDYAVSKYLSKYKGFDLGIDLTEEAILTFKKSESVCRLTNRRLKDPKTSLAAGVEPIILLAQRKISKVLGNYSTSKWIELCKWGPGATATLKGSMAHLANKICEDRLSITPAALPYMRRVLHDDHHWLSARGLAVDGPMNVVPTRDHFNVIDACRVTTVDKTAKAERTIAVEPTCNTFLQGGIGQFIRKRLLSVGIDLRRQNYNQELARDSFADQLATIDLSAASDSICTELVYLLLPLEWAFALDDLRSKKASFPDGTTTHLEKFSSMGNGFTFELETLIFWAITQSVVDHYKGRKFSVKVYGDDIIVPCEYYDQTIDSLAYFGFSTNVGKSYCYPSAFFESCGKHYFHGHDVTPVYQKEEITTLPEQYRAHNRIIRWAKLTLPDQYDVRARPAVRCAERQIEPLRHRIPLSSEDDDGLLSPSALLSTNQHGRHRCKVLSFRNQKVSIRDSAPLLSYWLRFNPEPWSFTDRVPVRRKGKFVSRWRQYPFSCGDTYWF